MNTSLITALINVLQSMKERQEDDAMLRDIVREQRRPSTEALPRSPTVRVQGAVPVRPGVSLSPGRGWVEPKPIEDWRPPGLAIMDRMMDAEDARWRAERKKEFGGG